MNVLSPIGLLLTASLIVSSADTSPVEDVDVLEDVDSAIAAAEALESSSLVDDFMLQLPTAEVDVTSEGVSSTAIPGTNLELGLPGAPLTSREPVDDSQIISEGKGYSLAVSDEQGGAFRTLIHIESELSPMQYDFEVSEEFSLDLLEDGGVALRDLEGNLTATIPEPWALDSNGVPVDTKYELSGNTITQHVYPRASHVFPVVADPFFIPFLGIVAGQFTRHAVTQMAKRGVSKAVAQRVVQNGKSTRGNKGTTVFTQGSGKSKIRVVVDNRSGNIITVTRG